MRTRCKFTVVGVEDTTGRIFRKIYADAEGYADIEAHEYEESSYHPTRKGQKYKSFDAGKYQQNIRLAAVYDTANAEDVSFSDSTPSGELRIFVTNPIVVGTFKPGDSYYLDLIPCDK